jgi:SAM-dependent methyltransferase
MRIKNCRICGFSIVKIFSLGKIPIVNYFLSEEDLLKKEKKYSLNLCLCQNCGLVQIDEIVPPEDLFTIYHYFSSTSRPLVEHLENLAKTVIDRFSLKGEDKVLDIGCNDAALLSVFKKSGMQTLGIDPSKNVIENAKKSGVDVLTLFFDGKIAWEVLNTYGKFDVIFATNTLAQIVSLKDFIVGIDVLLKKDGIFILEVGYLGDMIRKKTFDSIYHEHFSFFSILSLIALFKGTSFEIFDVERISNHGGSLRVFIKNKSYKKLKISKRLESLLEEEKAANLKNKKAYKEFVEFVINYKKDLRRFLLKLKKENKKIIGIGAPAKSVILLNYCDIDTSIIDYIVDSTPQKQNRFMPGVHIPILSEERLFNDKVRPDYVLMLAWTYREELLKKFKPLREKGVKIVIPFPKIEII